MKTEKNILIAFILNLAFSIYEFFGGIFTGSVAIISDSVHDLGDAISIGTSYFLEKKSKKEPDKKYTYGYLRYSMVGAFITTMILIIGSCFVIVESIKRLVNPVEVDYDGMIIISIIGVVVNFFAAYYTSKGDSMNQRAVNLHMLEDVLGWVIVLIGSILMKFTSINYIDSIMSIGVAIYIFIEAFKNLIGIINLFLEKVPKNIDVDEIKNELLKIDNIEDIHHIHVWSMDEVNNYATMHIITDNENKHDIKTKIREKLKEYKINHVTIELENKAEECDEEKCHINSEKK